MKGGESRAMRRAQYVAGRTDEQLSFVERGFIRWLTIRAIPIVLPRKFRRQVGGDIDGVLELRLINPTGGEPDCIQLAMHRGRCRGTRRGSARADASATMRIVDLVRLATASVDPGWLAHDGRIVLTGDPFLFIRFPAAFGLPTRPLYAAPRGPNLRD